MARPRAEQVAQQRRQRIKFGDPKLRLGIPPELKEELDKKGLIGRIVNDNGKGRIEGLRMRGYEFYTSDDMASQLGEPDASGTADLGSRVSRVVGLMPDGKTPMRAYLMVQRKEDYEEDQAIKEQENKRVDDAIRRGEPGGPNQAAVNEKGGGTYVKEVNYQP